MLKITTNNQMILNFSVAIHVLLIINIIFCNILGQQTILYKCHYHINLYNSDLALFQIAIKWILYISFFSNNYSINF